MLADEMNDAFQMAIGHQIGGKCFEFYCACVNSTFSNHYYDFNESLKNDELHSCVFCDFLLSEMKTHQKSLTLIWILLSLGKFRRGKRSNQYVVL